jgi:hypothetical protein
MDRKTEGFRFYQVDSLPLDLTTLATPPIMGAIRLDKVYIYGHMIILKNYIFKIVYQEPTIDHFLKVRKIVKYERERKFQLKATKKVCPV